MENSPIVIRRYLTYDTLPVVNIKSIETSSDKNSDLSDDKKDEGWKKKVINIKR